MEILVFGNRDEHTDDLALKVSYKLASTPKISFKIIEPNSDLPLSKNGTINIIDTVYGIDKVTLITEKNIDQLIPPPRTSAHDYDLGFQLKYLKKLGMINKINIIGLPFSGEIDYDLIHSILRKLVAQDMQGS